MENIDIIQIISQVGFPIAVAAYCLIRLDKTMRVVERLLAVIAEKLDVTVRGDNN